MNVRKIKKEFAEKYPEATIILLPHDHPREILCEIDPATNHPDYSVAISVIERSAPHYHKIATEEYEVLSGEITLFLGDEKRVLKPGDKVIIKPGTVHWTKAKSARVKCTSRPGGVPKDHILYERRDFESE